MLLEVAGVGKRYETSNFYLEDLNLSVEPGMSLGLVGQNGTGKSTILQMLNGTVLYDQGEVRYHGKALHEMSAPELRSMRKNIVYIFQKANLLPNKTVAYHLALVDKLAKRPVNQERIEEIMAFMHLTRLKNSRCISLSGGEQQKVAIAMALLQDAEVLLCDEISSALDAHSEQEIIQLLQKIREERQMAMVMIAHNLSLVKNFCDEVLLIHEHTIQERVKPKHTAGVALSRDYVHDVKEFLLHAD